MYCRIIPRLDIKGPNLVKGINLEGVRVLGDPHLFAEAYYKAGADELLYMDAVASLYDRKSLLGTIEKTAEEIFIPLTVGGGLRSLDDIQAVLNVGADKVAINTAAVKRPEFIREASLRFGSSTIVISIEAKSLGNGRFEAYIDNGREPTGREVIDWARQAEDLGAGEIMVTSIDREGLGRGLEIGLVQDLSQKVSIPVIVGGGTGKMEHVRAAFKSGASAVCLASVLHYHLLRSTDSARAGLMPPQGVERFSIPDLKDFLESCSLKCRPALMHL